MTQRRHVGTEFSRIENDLRVALARYCHLGGGRERAEELLARTFDPAPNICDANKSHLLFGKKIPW